MFKHTDANGKVMLIAEMSNDHLINMIKLLLNRIKECSSYIDAIDNGEAPKTSALQRSVYGESDTPLKKELAKKILNSSISALPKYIMESHLRELSFSSELQKTFGRSSVYTPVMPTLFLSAEAESYVSRAGRIVKDDDGPFF